MLEIIVAPNFFVSSVNALQLFMRPSGFSIRLVISRNLMPGMGLGCNGSEKLPISDDPLLPLHAAVNNEQGVNLFLTLNNYAKVEVHVFDVLGRKIGTSISDQLSSGQHNFSLLDDRQNPLAPGQYFYKINVNGNKTFSKSFLVK